MEGKPTHHPASHSPRQALLCLKWVVSLPKHLDKAERGIRWRSGSKAGLLVYASLRHVKEGVHEYPFEDRHKNLHKQDCLRPVSAPHFVLPAWNVEVS